MTTYRRLNVVFLSASCIVGAIGLAPGIAAASGGLASELGPGVSVTRQDETGKVGFIGTEPGDAIDVGLPASASAVRVAKSFIDSYAKGFGVDEAGASLKLGGTDRTSGDGTAVHLQQFQNGLPVLGGELTVSLNADDQVLSVLGETSPSPSVSSAASVTADEAIVAAIATVAREKHVSADELTASVPKLQVYDPRLLSAPGPLQQARTAWVLEVTSTDKVSEPIDVFAVVDAELGAVALHFDQIKTALNRSVCDAVNTSTKYPCTAPSRIEGQGATGNSDVDHAYDYAGDTHNFFFSRFGRDSLDGAGLPLLSTVRYCDPSLACPYQNAFWDGSQMVYGQGFADADDVVGHELAHGFTDFTSHLFYYAQSGAINESMSDVFGEYIDQTNAAGTDTPAVKWKLGEDIPGIGAIRDMKTPGAFGDPDRMTSANFTADVNETDGGGVHTNSGVNNKAAYLLADGSAGEAGGTFNGQTIGAIGITKAARIYYETETAMLGSASDYADLGNALNQACSNLIGTDGITAGDCTNVSKSVQATEMATNPTNSPTVTAPACTPGSPVNVFSDDLENTGSGNWTSAATVGFNSWFYPQNPNLFVGFDATYATSGTTNIFGGDRSTVSDSSIRATNATAIPAGAFMRFNHSYGFEDDPLTAYDGGVVEYSTAGAGGPWTDAGSLFDSASGYNGTISSSFDNPLAGRSAFVRESNGYGASRLNLSSLAGQNVMFRFRIGSDSSVNDYGWFIDDVSIYTCAVLPTLSIADQSKAEGDAGQSNADLTVTLNPASGSTVTVNYATSDGTATQPGDYTSSSGTVTFNPGQTATTASVPVTGDTIDETDETFSVDLSSPTNATIADGHGVGTITDDDPPDTFIISGPLEGSTIADSTPSFGFSATQSGSTFECRIDGANFAACSGPVATHTPVSALANGQHTFDVRAVDSAAQADPTPATRTFTVDTFVPVVPKAKTNKVKVSGPKKVKKGKKAIYKVKIRNSGNATATGVRLKVRGRGVSFKTSVGKIGAGRARTVKVKLKPRKPGKVKITFKVTSKNAGGKTVRKKITVKK
ncbi:MAG: M4 family metallopeptidase [Thermoleophilia bacterium]|nr:M4 family metallopeptidase [Thermoleophilia bacterium]